jgi:hypothetical protein
MFVQIGCLQGIGIFVAEDALSESLGIQRA